VGTVVYALAIGPITHVTIPALAVDAVPARAARAEESLITPR
jgi:hypothetical protein